MKAAAITILFAVSWLLWLLIDGHLGNQANKRLPSRMNFDGNKLRNIEVTSDFCLIVQMVSVCIGQGSSIASALFLVGRTLDAVTPPQDTSKVHPLTYVGYALQSGVSWHWAWVNAVERQPILIRLKDALEPTWTQGSSPLGVLNSLVESMNEDEEKSIHEASTKLSVNLLLPMGLCFLPAFILIGVVPAIAAFAGGM